MERGVCPCSWGHVPKYPHLTWFSQDKRPTAVRSQIIDSISSKQLSAFDLSDFYMVQFFPSSAIDSKE